MTKSELINKWQKEAADWKIAADNKTFKDKTVTMAYHRHKQLLICIEDIKNLNGATVKLREVCQTCKGTGIYFFSDRVPEDCPDCKP